MSTVWSILALIMVLQPAIELVRSTIDNKGTLHQVCKIRARAQALIILRASVDDTHPSLLGQRQQFGTQYYHQVRHLNSRTSDIATECLATSPDSTQEFAGAVSTGNELFDITVFQVCLLGRKEGLIRNIRFPYPSTTVS